MPEAARGIFNAHNQLEDNNQAANGRANAKITVEKNAWRKQEEES